MIYSIENEIPIWILCVIIIVLFVQGVYLFVDARKRNAYPWFWGVIGILSFPLPVILYAILVKKLFRKK